MDFVSFHYFSTDYQNDFINAVTQYRSFKQGQGFTEAQMPVMLTEWLPQVGNPNGYNSNQAADAANLFLAFDQANLWGQGGVPFEDYGTQAFDQWGTVSYPDATPKPIFYVYQFFDAISRANAGINYATESIEVDVPNSSLQKKFKVGERKRVFAQLPTKTCFKFGSWNRLASAQDAAFAFLLGEGVTLADLQSAYGKDSSTMINGLLAAIKALHPFDPKWATAFANANLVYLAVDEMNTNKEFSYDLTFSDFVNVSAATGQSLGRKGIYTHSAQLNVNGNHLLYSLLPQEVLLAQICF